MRVGMEAGEVPLLPDADAARQWLVDELSKPEYREHSANWLQRVMDWLSGVLGRLLTWGTGDGGFSLPQVVVLVLLAALLVGVVVYLVRGPLRRSRLSRRSAAVFDDDVREATVIRDAAREAASAQDWDRAVIEAFRALVRGAEERHVVEVVPGMTALEFTRAAGVRLPEVAADLAACTEIFDGVRYGHLHATPAHYERLVAADAATAAATPVALR